MDHKRNLIILALAVVSYFLLLAWNKDYPSVVPAAPIAQSVQPEVPNASDLPGSTGTGATDLPTPPQTAAAATAAAPAASSLITVITPLQEVVIDLAGGDILSIRLPTFPTSVDTPNDPFRLLRNDEGMHFIAQSGLVGTNGSNPAAAGRPRFTSTQTSYSITEGQLNVDLIANVNGVNLTKRYRFNADDFLIGLDYVVDNHTSDPLNLSLSAQLKRDASLDPSNASGFRRTFLGAVMTSPDDPYMKASFKDIDKGNIKPVTMMGGWVGFSQHYFFSGWIPSADDTNTFSVRHNDAGEYLIGFVGPVQTIAPGQSATLSTNLWAGPKDQDRLAVIAPNLGQIIDYGKLWFVAYPIFWLLSQIYKFVGNFGVAIILLTIVIRVLFLPLSAKQYDSQAKMKKLQPKIEQLKTRYGDDKQKFVQAQMELWKKEKVNPFGGCLPVLLQMPVFLGIYWVLNESVELRQAPFMLWYRDLSMMDSFFLLPLLLGGAYFLQQHMTPLPTTDPTQAKMMKWMPVLFTGFFLWFPAGLVLYYLMNTLLGILQQWYFSRKLDKQSAAKGA